MNGENPTTLRLVFNRFFKSQEDMDAFFDALHFYMDCVRVVEGEKRRLVVEVDTTIKKASILVDIAWIYPETFGCKKIVPIGVETSERLEIVEAFCTVPKYESLFP